MSRRLRDHGPKEPKHRINGSGARAEVHFFPNEVARSLAIEHIDYSQLRSFYCLIRNPAGTEEGRSAIGRGWSRFTFTDLACLVVAIDRCGGPSLLQPGRRLTWVNLPEACAALYRQGFQTPLLNVQLHRIGRHIYAEFDGLVQDPATGQLTIEAVAEQVDASPHFRGSLLRDRELARALNAEVSRYRGVRTR